MSAVRIKAAVLCWIAMNLIGCVSPTTSAPSKTNAQLWADTARQADALRVTQKTFEKTHHFIGATAQVAMRELGDEGFQCSLEYKMLPTLEKGSIDHFVSENVPMIYCSKPHVQEHTDDVCRVFWAAFEINWQDPARPPEVLKEELSTRTVKKELYFCRVGEDKK